jgi:hypothetical protein
MMSFSAKFPGRCARTGNPINRGDMIESVGKGRYALLAPPMNRDDDESAAAERYMTRAGLVSDVWVMSSGKELYRNKRGRCEDAPCCGCCNV